MTSTLVVIDANARTERQIASGSEAELVTFDGGKAGLNACCAIEPDGVVVGSALKDADPIWVLESIRSQPTGAGKAVLIAILDDDDETRLARLYAAGADVCLRRPKRAAVLVAAIEAALALGARVRTDSVLPTGRPRGRSSVPASGQIEDGIVMITMRQLEAGRRSGELQFVGFSGKTLVVEFASGVLTGGRIGARALDNAAALREALHWEEGRFDFIKRPQRSAPPDLPNVTTLLASIDRKRPASKSIRPASKSTRPASKSIRPARRTVAPSCEAEDEIIEAENVPPSRRKKR